jgi:hypothetical protein
MFPTTTDALAIILLAIVPGYIANTVWSRARTWKGRGSDLITVLQSLAISAAIQVVAAPCTAWLILPYVHTLDGHVGRLVVWAIIVVFLIPLLGGRFIGWLADSGEQTTSPWGHASSARWLRKQYRKLVVPISAPTLWDSVFANSVPINAFVVVEFKDGKFIAGVFGEGAEVYTTPDPQALYLPQRWTVDDHGEVIARLSGSLGVMITNTADVRSVRILEGGGNGSGQPTSTP